MEKRQQLLKKLHKPLVFANVIKHRIKREKVNEECKATHISTQNTTRWRNKFKGFLATKWENALRDQ
jgi:hypothetical protein